MNRRTTFTLIALWTALAALWALPDAMQAMRERRAIEAVAAAISAGTPPEAVPQRLQTAVERRVHWVVVGRRYDVSSRPFLRQTAWETWESREGTCGDGARLLVALLRATGRRAARINLAADETGFGHVAVVYKEGERWRLLDSIGAPPAFAAWADANQRPLDELIRFSSSGEGGGRFIADNPFFSRYSFYDFTRLTGGTFIFNWVADPPRWVVALLESPPLLRVAAKIALALLLLPLFLLLMRRLIQQRMRSPS